MFSRPSLTLSFIAPRSDASRFRSFGPEDEAFGGAFLYKPQASGFFSFLSPNHSRHDAHSYSAFQHEKHLSRARLKAAAISGLWVSRGLAECRRGVR